MAMTEEQQERARAELLQIKPALDRLAPVERDARLRAALERAGCCPTWEEWEAFAAGVLGEEAPAA